jgi:hypothetical protein
MLLSAQHSHTLSQMASREVSCLTQKAGSDYVPDLVLGHRDRSIPSLHLLMPMLYIDAIQGSCESRLVVHAALLNYLGDGHTLAGSLQQTPSQPQLQQ